MMSYRSSLLLACLQMIDANIWRELETVILFTGDVGSIFFATFSRASCTALMVAFFLGRHNFAGDGQCHCY